MARTEMLSDDELRARRGEILRKFNMTLDDFRDRARDYALVGGEHEAWGQLESIAFLLGETRV
jgi:hypothetical protein